LYRTLSLDGRGQGEGEVRREKSPLIPLYERGTIALNKNMTSPPFVKGRVRGILS
jgi:hypothetical protein